MVISVQPIHATHSKPSNDKKSSAGDLSINPPRENERSQLNPTTESCFQGQGCQVLYQSYSTTSQFSKHTRQVWKMLWMPRQTFLWLEEISV